MAELQWIWDDPIGIPEAEDIGPAVGSGEIAQWEMQYGVPFPPILKRAYGQQDGGYVRGSDRGVILLRLRNIEPVEADLLSELSSDSEEVQVDSARLFYLGGDDTGATLLLGYSNADTGGADPSVFAFYSDGGEIESLTDTVDALFGDTPHG